MNNINNLDWTFDGKIVTKEERDKYPHIYEMFNDNGTCAHDIKSRNSGGVYCTKCPAWFCQ